MFPVRLTVVLILSLGSCLRASADDGLLLHFSLNEGRGALAGSATGQGPDGMVSASWARSPSGHALSFDGRPEHIVQVQVPVEHRFGKGSWSYSAWLKPTRLSIDDIQNQRRIFSFGTYPDANLVIDLLDSGRLSYYFSYRGKEGSLVTAGGSSATGIATGQWAYVALVCDRARGRVETYINGVSQGISELLPHFEGEFSLGGELTLGSGWHNYWGLMDEVRVYRRALTRSAVKAEYARLKSAFGVIESPRQVAARHREDLEDVFAKVHDAWAAGNFNAVRAGCEKVVKSTEAPAPLRSIAHLRLAQSYAAQNQLDCARAEYARIAATTQYPEVHRAERANAAENWDESAEACPLAIRRLADRGPPHRHVCRGGLCRAEGRRLCQRFASQPGGQPGAPRDLVRALHSTGVKGAIAVNVLPGEYPLIATLALKGTDSGTEHAPVVYRAVEPGQSVFFGGKRLRGFQPVTDPSLLARLPQEARGKVVQCDLRAQGITDFGQLAVRGCGQPAPPPTLELFVDKRPMTLALAQFRLREHPQARRAGKLRGEEALRHRVPRRSSRALGPGRRRLAVWLLPLPLGRRHDQGLQDRPGREAIDCGEAYDYGGAGMDAGQSISYYVFNLLEEIDQPGEWYLDRRAGVLYLYRRPTGPRDDRDRHAELADDHDGPCQ